ncbi:MAG: Rne/Rng family ribonuclease [Actinomycetaceae bacterium]|nr:Rne/Rng family ribonuclease [Actinomycetaceae bacterium]
MSTESNTDSPTSGVVPSGSPFVPPVFSAADDDNVETSRGAVEKVAPAATLLFQPPQIERAEPVRALPRESSEAEHEAEEDVVEETPRRSRRKSSADKESDAHDEADSDVSDDEESASSSVRRRRRRRPRSNGDDEIQTDEVAGVKGSTRLEAKRQRRKEGRRDNRRRTVVTESEFLARRESVKREMIVREKEGLNQIAVLEDGLLVEHYVARHTQQTVVGNIYYGRVQNVLPSMEAAFIDLGKGRNAVLYAGEVNWDAVGLGGRPRRIEQALKSGDQVLVQVTKDPIGHKGARLTSQITLAGRFLVLVPSGSMTGISRKLPEKERARLKKLLSKIVPKDSGVIVRTAAEGATEKQLRDDVERLQEQWKEIEKKRKKASKSPTLLRSEPELAVRVVRDVFTEDFQSLTVQGKATWKTISEYVTKLSPDLKDRLVHWTKKEDVFAAHRIDEQLMKGMDRKVWLPSGGSLVIDRTEAMTVVDVNTGKFIGSGGTLEETVTRNNLEAAEEIVRQLRLRDIGGIVVIDFVDMVLESNRDLVLRRLVECLGRDRTRHQVTEITALGLVQMTRKRVGEGLVEAFSTPCECCDGRGFIVHTDPVEKDQHGRSSAKETKKNQRKQKKAPDPQKEEVRTALSAIAKATASAHQDNESEPPSSDDKSTKHKRTNKASARKGTGKKSATTAKSHDTDTEPIALPDPVVEPKKKARSGRRSVVMEAGEPQSVPQVENGDKPETVSIARPAAMSVDDIKLPDPSDRPAKKKSRRVVVSSPTATGEASDGENEDSN